MDRGKTKENRRGRDSNPNIFRLAHTIIQLFPIRGYHVIVEITCNPLRIGVIRALKCAPGLPLVHFLAFYRAFIFSISAPRRRLWEYY